MDDDAPLLSPTATRLVGLAEAGQFDDLEAAWLETLEADAYDLADLVHVLRHLADAGHTRQIETLAWYLFTEAAETRGPAEALSAVRRTADILPDAANLREAVAGLYRGARRDYDGLDVLLGTTVEDAGVPLGTRVRQLEKLLALPPGTFVRDARRSTPGRVEGVNPKMKGIRVVYGESSKTYDAEGIDALELLEPDDYAALAEYEPARLKALADADPVRLVTLCLAAHGPRMPLKDLKEALAPAVKSSAWSAWWKGARPKLKRAAEIEMGDGARPEFRLRERPMTYEAQIRRDLETAPTEADRLRVVLEHLRHPSPDPEVEVGVLGLVTSLLAARVPGDGPVETPVGLATLAVLAEVQRREGAPTLEAAPGARLPAEARLPALLAGLADDDLAAEVVELVRRARPETWPAVVAEALPRVSPATAELVAEALEEAGRTDLVTGAVEPIVGGGRETAGAMAWLWKAAGGTSPRIALDAETRRGLAVAMLRAADDLKRDRPRDGERDPLTDLQRALSAKGYEDLGRVFKEADDGQARGLRVVLDRNEGLTDLQRIRVLDLLRSAHPDLYAKPVLPPWEEDAVYTTGDALHAKQEEFDDIVNAKMLENSKAIGAAAELGDISENSEFTAALEERDRLAERANAIQEQLAKARVITPTLADSATVTVGSAVRARNLETGEEERLLFLGPWDSDPDRGVYYYKTRVGMAFMGKAVGEVAELNLGGTERRWEVLEVEPGV